MKLNIVKENFSMEKHFWKIQFKSSSYYCISINGWIKMCCNSENKNIGWYMRIQYRTKRNEFGYLKNKNGKLALVKIISENHRSQFYLHFIENLKWRGL